MSAARLHILSDLHVEYGDFAPPLVEADLVIIAGDVHTAGRGPTWALRTFDRPVVFVPGNHDFWGISIDRFRREAERHKARIPAAERRCPELHILEAGEPVEIAGVRCIGATLWTDFDLHGDGTRDSAMWHAEQAMLDYRRIRAPSFGRLRACDTREAHLHPWHLCLDASEACQIWIQHSPSAAAGCGKMANRVRLVYTQSGRDAAPWSRSYIRLVRTRACWFP